METIRITCINKAHGNHSNPHEAIQKLGWVSDSNGRSGIDFRLEVVKFLEQGNTAYVADRFGNKAYLYVRISPSNNKFVQTVADGKYSDNLLALPECKG